MLLIIFSRDLSQHPVISAQALQRLQQFAIEASENWIVIDPDKSFQVASLGKELVLNVKHCGNLVQSLSRYHFEGNKLSIMNVQTLEGQYLDSVTSANELAFHLPLLEKILLS